MVTTPGQVIEALGGLNAVAKLTGRTYRAVWNWKQNRFPANTYHVMQHALAALDISAPASLWGQSYPFAATDKSISETESLNKQ